VSHGTLLEDDHVTEEGVDARLIGCGALTEPATAVKLREEGAAVKVGAGAARVNVTGTRTADPEVGVSVTVPLYVPLASEPGVAVTMREPGVPPVFEVNVNHGTLDVAVQARLVPDGFVMLMVCEGGAEPPAVPENVREVGFTTSEAAGVRVNETGIICGLLFAPGDVKVSDAL
jgi:hypothetical protein